MMDYSEITEPSRELAPCLEDGEVTPRRQRKRRERPTPARLLYRFRETSHALGCSDSHTLRLERRGLLTPVYLPGEEGKRGAKRHFAAQVEALARTLFDEASRAAAERISA